jgi:hypothetical protein
MRKTKQRMGIREHRMMTEHGNEKRRTRNENSGRTRMTELEWWQNTKCQTTVAVLIRMGMGFVGRGNEKERTKNRNEQGMRMVAKRECQNWNGDRT